MLFYRLFYHCVHHFMFVPGGFVALSLLWRACYIWPSMDERLHLRHDTSFVRK